MAISTNKTMILESDSSHVLPITTKARHPKCARGYVVSHAPELGHAEPNRHKPFCSKSPRVCLATGSVLKTLERKLPRHLKHHINSDRLKQIHLQICNQFTRTILEPFTGNWLPFLKCKLGVVTISRCSTPLPRTQLCRA